MAIQLTTVISGRNKELEAALIAAVKREPVSRSGGRSTPRELTFQVRSAKDAINARMRVYLHMKKLGEDVTVKIAGLSYKKQPAAE